MRKELNFFFFFFFFFFFNSLNQFWSLCPELNTLEVSMAHGWASIGKSASTSSGCGTSDWRRCKTRLKEFGDRLAVVLRHEQHPLHHEHDAHRDVGNRQIGPILSAAPGRRTRSTGISARRRSTTRCMRPGWARAARGPGFPPCAARCRPGAGRGRRCGAEIRIELGEARPLHRKPLGVDAIEPPVLVCLTKRKA